MDLNNNLIAANLLLIDVNALYLDFYTNSAHTKQEFTEIFSSTERAISKVSELFIVPEDDNIKIVESKMSSIALAKKKTMSVYYNLVRKSHLYAPIFPVMISFAVLAIWVFYLPTPASNLFNSKHSKKNIETTQSCQITEAKVLKQNSMLFFVKKALKKVMN